jgi:tetratricopeptide (TPR) repeat protein
VAKKVCPKRISLHNCSFCTVTDRSLPPKQRTMSLDVDAFLDTEKRTGIKNDDIDSFLSKVNDVQKQLDMLQSGELKPEDVKVPGEKTAEELKEEAEEKALRAREKAARKAKEKKEEHEKWWRGARFRVESLEERREQREVIEPVEIEGHSFPKPKSKGKDCIDYSVWEKWIPDDPVSLEELRKKEQEVNKDKDALFEKNNPDFCENFMDDMKKREKSRLSKETTAEVQKQKGNRAFKRRDYEAALRRYWEALDALPFLVPVLSNMAQCYIKLKQYDDAIEFCSRAIFLKPTWVKAYSRRALAKRRKKMYKEAIEDLDAGLKIEPENESLLNEHRVCVDEWEEVKGEAFVKNAMAPQETEMEPAEGAKDAPASAADEAGAKDDEKKEEPGEAEEVSVTEVPAVAPKTAVERPSSFKLIDKLMGKVVGNDGSTIQVAFKTLAGALKGDDETGRIYLRSAGHFEKLLSCFMDEAGSLLPKKRRKYDIGLLSALTAACVNRKNQQLFVKNGAFVVLEARVVELISTEDGEIDVDAAIAVGNFFETMVDHALMQKRLQKEKHQQLIPCLVEILKGTENSTVTEAFAGALSVLALKTADAEQFYNSCSLFKRDVVEVAGTMLLRSSKERDKAAGAAAREALTRLLANLLLHPRFRKHVAKDDIIGGLLSVLAGESDSAVTQANALAALMNGAVQHADTPESVYGAVRSSLVKQGAVSLLLILLGMKGANLGAEVYTRSAGLLARCALDKEGRKKLCEAHAFELLVDVMSAANGPALGHLIRIVAVCLKDGDKTLRDILRKKEGSRKIVDIVKMAGESARKHKLKKDADLSNLVGNGMKALIPCLGDVNDPIVEQMSQMGLIENVIEVLKGCGEGPVKKNTAIVLAKLCRHPKLNTKIRALRGVEILMSLGKELGL